MQLSVGIDPKLAQFSLIKDAFPPAEHTGITLTALSHDQRMSALLSGDIDASICWLRSLPTKQPEALTIGALTIRVDPGYGLYINPSAIDTGQLLGLKHGAKVYCPSKLLEIQLSALRPDLSLVVAYTQADALALSVEDLPELEGLEGYSTKSLSAKEFIPEPGLGVIAWQCLSQDTKVLQTLRRIHCSEIASLTNVERGLERMFEGESKGTIGAYCERDALGNYHAFALRSWNGDLKQARVSSATNAGLAVSLFQRLS